MAGERESWDEEDAGVEPLLDDEDELEEELEEEWEDEEAHDADG